MPFSLTLKFPLILRIDLQSLLFKDAYYSKATSRVLIIRSLLDFQPKLKMLAAVWLLLSYVLTGLIPACCGFTDWIYPGQDDSNLTFNYIDVVYFTWASSIDEPWMNLWCAPRAGEPQSKDYGKFCAQGCTASKSEGLQVGGESSHFLNCNSIPLAGADQRFQPPVLPVQRL